MEIQRYDLEASWVCLTCGAEHETTDLAPSELGGYVEYVDYERLEAENDELRAAINRLDEERRIG